MAKKSFTAGLESLFVNLAEEKEQVDNPLLRRHRKRPERLARKAPAERKMAHAGGTEDESFKDALEAFFRDELADKVVQRAEEDAAEQPKRSQDRPRRPKGGIDSLIQGTIVKDQLELGRKDSSERVTFVFDKDHVSKLKSIARLEKTYLKNIVTELILDFISTYESKHGQIL